MVMEQVYWKGKTKWLVGDGKIENNDKGPYYQDETISTWKIITNLLVTTRKKNVTVWSLISLLGDCIAKCDPAPLNEALWGEYQNLEKYFTVINTILLLISMQKLLFYDISIKIYEMLNTALYNIIQNHFTERWAVKDCNSSGASHSVQSWETRISRKSQLKIFASHLSSYITIRLRIFMKVVSN